MLRRSHFPVCSFTFFPTAKKSSSNSSLSSHADASQFSGSSSCSCDNLSCNSAQSVFVDLLINDQEESEKASKVAMMTRRRDGHIQNKNNNNGFSFYNFNGSSMFRPSPLRLARFQLGNAKIGCETVRNTNVPTHNNCSSSPPSPTPADTTTSQESTSSSSLNPLLANIPRAIYLYSWEGYQENPSPSQDEPNQDETSPNVNASLPDVISFYVVDFSPSMDDYNFTDPAKNAIASACNQMHEAKVVNDPVLVVFSSNAASTVIPNSSGSVQHVVTNLCTKIRGGTHPTAAFDVVIEKLKQMVQTDVPGGTTKNLANAKKAVNITFMTDGEFNGTSSRSYAEEFQKFASELANLLAINNNNNNTIGVGEGSSIGGFAAITANLIGLKHDSVDQIKLLRDKLVGVGGVETTYTTCQNVKDLDKIFSERALMAIEEGRISTAKSVTFNIVDASFSSSAVATVLKRRILREPTSLASDTVESQEKNNNNNNNNKIQPPQVDFLVSTVPLHLNIPQSELESIQNNRNGDSSSSISLQVTQNENFSSSNLGQQSIHWEEEATVKTRFIHHAKSVRSNLNETQFSIWMDKAMLYGGRTTLICENIRQNLEQIEKKYSEQTTHDDKKLKQTEILNLLGNMLSIGQNSVEIPLAKIRDELHLSLVTTSYSNSILVWCRDARDDFFELMSKIQILAEDRISEKFKLESYSCVMSPTQAKHKRTLDRRALRNMALSSLVDGNSKNNINHNNSTNSDGATVAPATMARNDCGKIDVVAISSYEKSTVFTLQGRGTCTSNSNPAETNNLVSNTFEVPFDLSYIQSSLPIQSFDWNNPSQIAPEMLVGFTYTSPSSSSSSSSRLSSSNKKHQRNRDEAEIFATPDKVIARQQFSFNSLSCERYAASIQLDENGNYAPGLNSLNSSVRASSSSPPPMIVPLVVHPVASSLFRDEGKTDQNNNNSNIFFSPSRILFRENHNVRAVLSALTTGTPLCFSETDFRIYTGIFKQLFLSSNPMWIFALDSFSCAMMVPSFINKTSDQQNNNHNNNNNNKPYLFTSRYFEPLTIADCIRCIFHEDNFPRVQMNGWDAACLLLSAAASPNSDAIYRESFSEFLVATSDENIIFLECLKRCWANTLTAISLGNYLDGIHATKMNNDTRRRRRFSNSNHQKFDPSSLFQEITTDGKSANVSLTTILEGSLKNIPNIPMKNDVGFLDLATALLHTADYFSSINKNKNNNDNINNNTPTSSLEVFLAMKKSSMSHLRVSAAAPEKGIQTEMLSSYFHVPSDVTASHSTSLLHGINIGGRAKAGLFGGKKFVPKARFIPTSMSGLWDLNNNSSNVSAPSNAVANEKFHGINDVHIASNSEKAHRLFRINREFFIRRNNNNDKKGDVSSHPTNTTSADHLLTLPENILPPFRFNHDQRRQLQKLFINLRLNINDNDNNKIKTQNQFMGEMFNDIFAPPQKTICQACLEHIPHFGTSMQALFESLSNLPENVVPALAWNEPNSNQNASSALRNSHHRNENNNITISKKKKNAKWLVALNGGLFTNAVTSPLSVAFLHPIPKKEFSRTLFRLHLGVDRFMPRHDVGIKEKEEDGNNDEDKADLQGEEIGKGGSFSEKLDLTIATAWEDMNIRTPLSLLERTQSSAVASDKALKKFCQVVDEKLLKELSEYHLVAACECVKNTK